MCYAMLRDAEQAKDAVQETFVKAYRAMDDWRGACSEKTWLTRIAVNTCRDMRRSAWFGGSTGASRWRICPWRQAARTWKAAS